ncbi:MAG TPA: SAM-dependent methyltransferase, partial [Burkholderiaceae bacterium]|nr:SAM-dependent methyltransferase [Burkholderiaceae bacterium]
MNTESMQNRALVFSGAGVSISNEPLPPQARFVLAMLENVKHGALQLRLPDGRCMLFGDGSSPLTLELKNWNLFAAALKSGDIGFAETFIDGGWTTDNLPGLIELFIRNRDSIES